MTVRGIDVIQQRRLEYAQRRTQEVKEAYLSSTADLESMDERKQERMNLRQRCNPGSKNVFSPFSSVVHSLLTGIEHKKGSVAGK